MSWKPHDPPKLSLQKENNPTGNAALDALAWMRFPHLFLELARRFDAPHELLVVLLYLWDATVGQPQMVDGEHDSSRNPKGHIALSQIPVRHQQRDKWIDALIASRLFLLVEKAPPESKVGSLYEYNNAEATTRLWFCFFAMSSMVTDFSGDKDDITREQFKKMFTPEALARWIDDKDGVPFLANPFLKQLSAKETK
jgi:hypothetical protein